MEFIIENCSSPGAQFSRSTNQVMLKIAEWINLNNEPDLMFIDFRRRLEKEAKINDNNARNIYPLLKNGGLVEYQAGGELETGSFFMRISQRGTGNSRRYFPFYRMFECVKKSFFEHLPGKQLLKK